MSCDSHVSTMVCMISMLLSEDAISYPVCKEAPCQNVILEVTDGHLAPPLWHNCQLTVWDGGQRSVINKQG